MGRVLPRNESNRELTNRLTRQSYPLGIIVNPSGEPFLDEGADFRNYTYAKYGMAILAQPGSIAYQIFDATLRPMLRTEEYDMPGISVHRRNPSRSSPRTSASIRTRAAGDHPQIQRRHRPQPTARPAVKDGRRADTAPPKSNWSSPLDAPPFYAYPVTCGITFTFGGLKSDTHGPR